MPYAGTASGAAALCICEALLLALNDRKILSELEIVGIMENAAAVHDSMPRGTADLRLHADAAALIRQIIAGGNSIGRA